MKGLVPVQRTWLRSGNGAPLRTVPTPDIAFPLCPEPLRALLWLFASRFAYANRMAFE